MKFKPLPTLLAAAACGLSFFAGRLGRADGERVDSEKHPANAHRGQAAGAPPAAGKASSGKPAAAPGATYASLLGPPTPEEEAKGPVERVRDAFAEPNEFRRLQLFWRALTDLKPEDAQGIQDLFDEGDRLGRHYPAEYQYFAQRWGEVDGAAAVTHGVQAWQHRGGMEGMLSRMADGWANQNPQQAVDWINTHDREQPWMREAVMSGLVNGLADRDLELARRFVEDQADSPQARQYFTQLADKYIYSKSLADAERWFDSLDTAKFSAPKGALMDHLTDRFLRGGPEQAAAFLDRHPDQVDVDSAMSIGYELNRKDPAKARIWAAALPEKVRTVVQTNLIRTP
ncbi:MAG: hypothetical protein V4726_22825 [Verrucomicrobiota bacterium]